MNRQTFALTMLAAATALVAFRPTASRADIAEGPFPVTRTDAEWRTMLSDGAYDVMRTGGTERAFSSPLNDISDMGTFYCKGCDNPLYSSETKFMSGTGWPSFTSALTDAIGTMDDRQFLFLVRTECHCTRCGSHLGHIFEDGPEPTGLRHCINGVAITFQAA
jgi:peptide-methionine (R)-S-oxide reductase